ncbi:uncharacterized protein LOC134180674 [Corticium candelabrum]|uniref:uncharacterized protein LOC134180674 n=1 Tax=Corticium candelabrum TaxID=121492 RepID=UPI002E25F21F|nr:uncharacterized protein LOC134180674 [Corticium candelabrum]
MGCTDSKIGDTATALSQLRASTTSQTCSHVDVRTGARVETTVSEHDPVVIMIFGGPGTGKGKVIEHLRSTFGFQLINGEDLIVRGIPKKLKISRNIVLKTHEDIKLLLDDEPHHLSLEWLCKMVSQEIMDRQVKEMRNVYLVDLMPNLKFMLKNEHLVKEDCAAAINEFEAKFPGTVTVELHLPVEYLAKTKSLFHPRLTNTKDSPGGQSDEADMSRTSRRHALYEKAANSFVKYFSQAERLIEVDASSGDKVAIWEAVRKLMSSLRFSAKIHDHVLVLFNFSNLHLDWNLLNMHVIRLVEIASTTDSVESAVETLARYVETTSFECLKFVVQVEGSQLDNIKTEQLKRAVMFTAPAPGHCDQQVREINDAIGQPDYFKALCSTDDETLVFPSSLGNEFCRRLTLLFSESHKACSKKTTGNCL